MIIDCHSHVWLSKEQLGQAERFSCIANPEIGSADPKIHLEYSEPADIVFVLGFVSNMLNAEIPNNVLLEYSQENKGRVIAFAGMDPAEEGTIEKLQEYHEQGFAGITLSPACQGFHPTDSRAMRIYELAESLSMPIYFLHGEKIPAVANLQFNQPVALDEVAQAFPNLKMVISHFGYPWVDQTIALLGKHPNIFSDVAGIMTRPWQAYRILTLAYEYDVMEKLLFGSDFPTHNVKSVIEAVYNLNKLTIDSILPAIPREHLRSMVERDSMTLLGLEKFVAAPTEG